MISRFIVLIALFISLHVHSETIPAVQISGTSTPGYLSGGMWGDSVQESCQALWNTGQRYGADILLPSVGNRCRAQDAYGNTIFDPWATAYPAYRCASTGVVSATPDSCNSYQCPSGQNWTLSGQQCIRPDCPPGAIRDSSGVCNDQCESRAQQAPITGWYASPVGQPSLESTQYCNEGCTVALNPSPTGVAYSDSSYRWQKYQLVQLGYGCNNGTGPQMAAAPPAQPPNQSPPEPEKKPACSPSEGVLTSTSGTVACVPAGIPGADTPVVNKQTTTTPYSDGSKTIVETITTRDPSTGAESKNTVTTRTPATLGPNAGGAGEAGVPGTSEGPSTSTSTNKGNDPTKPEDSDFCAKNPALEICKGGLNQEVTQKKIDENIKAIKDGLDPGSTPYDAVKDAKHSDESQQQLTEQNDLFKAAAKGEFDPTSASKTSWQTAMESGWFAPISVTGCQAWSGTVGGRQFTIDPCPTAAKISSILEYVLWFGVVVGIFVMFTGGQVRSS